MKLTIFLTVMFVLFFGAKIVTGLFVDSKPILAALQTPLTWLSVVTGVLASICILIKIIKEIKEIFRNGDKQ